MAHQLNNINRKVFESAYVCMYVYALQTIQDVSKMLNAHLKLLLALELVWQYLPVSARMKQYRDTVEG